MRQLSLFLTGLRPLQQTFFRHSSKSNKGRPAHRHFIESHLRSHAPGAFKPVEPEILDDLAFQSTSDDTSFLDTDKDPYALKPRECVLCKYKVKLDYKNPRLLSQFISSFTGRLYEKHITGLCEYQQTIVGETIRLSRRVGFMPVFHKDPKYLKDPQLFDPMRPTRANPF